VPFHNDREVGVLEWVLEADAAAIVEEFRSEVESSSFDLRRLML
jgi:hypothetical protein